MASIPFAIASATTGSFTLQGGIDFPTGVSATAHPLALIDNAPGALFGFGARSTGVTFCMEGVQTVETTDPAPPVRLPAEAQRQEACFPYSAFSMSLKDRVPESPAGTAYFVGIHPEPNAEAGWIATGPSNATPSGPATYTTGHRVAASGDSKSPYYWQPVAQDHVLCEAAGAITYAGAGELRFMGPTVHVDAHENATDYTTGANVTTIAPGVVEWTFRWVVIRFDAATVTLETSAPIQIAALDVPALSWDGRATFTPNAGTLHATGADYSPAPGDSAAYLDGRFSGSLAPHDAQTATLQVSGDLRATSLLVRPAPVGPVQAGFPLWGLLAVGTVVVAGGAAAVLVRRAQRTRAAAPVVPAPPNPGFAAILAAEVGEPPANASPVEQAKNDAERAAHAAQQHEWPTALHYLDQAAEGDPQHMGDALHEKGVILRHLGRLREAREAFENAAPYRSDGDSEMMAARCCLALDQPEDAEAFLLRALALPAPDVDVVKQIASGESFTLLRERPAVRAAVDAACARLNLSQA